MEKRKVNFRGDSFPLEGKSVFFFLFQFIIAEIFMLESFSIFTSFLASNFMKKVETLESSLDNCLGGFDEKKSQRRISRGYLAS